MRHLIFVVLLLLASCATHQVRCDGHLLPINRPAPHSVPNGDLRSSS